MLRHTEKLGSLTFAEGQRATLDINRTGVLTELLIHFKFTITNGTSAAVGPLWGALAAYIKRAELIVNGRDTIISMDGPGLIARALYEYGQPPKGTDATVVLTGTDTATAYDVVIPIPLFLPRSAVPLTTALPLQALGQATLALTFGTIADFYTTANGAAISLVTVDVHGRYALNVPTNQPFLARILDYKEAELTATSTRFEVTADVGSGLQSRSMYIQALVAGVASNLPLATGSIALDTGQFNFESMDAPVIQADNINKFDRATAQVGMYALVMEMFGQPMWINTARQVMPADLRLTFDATKQTGVNLFKIYRESIRPFKG